MIYGQKASTQCYQVDRYPLKENGHILSESNSGPYGLPLFLTGIVKLSEPLHVSHHQADPQAIQICKDEYE